MRTKVMMKIVGVTLVGASMMCGCGDKKDAPQSPEAFGKVTKAVYNARNDRDVTHYGEHDVRDSVAEYRNSTPDEKKAKWAKRIDEAKRRGLKDENGKEFK